MPLIALATQTPNTGPTLAPQNVIFIRGHQLDLLAFALIGTITAFITSWLAAANLEAEEMIHDELSITEGRIEALTAEIGELTAMVGRLLTDSKTTETSPAVSTGDR